MLAECAGPQFHPVSEVPAGLCLEGWGMEGGEVWKNLGCSFKIFILPINFCIVAFETLVTKATRITTSAHWNAQ